MSTRIIWHPEKFLHELHTDLENRLEDSANVVKEKSKELCPVDTGRLRESIDKDTDRRELVSEIGSDVSYAIYQELGTRYIRPKSYLRRGLISSVNKIRSIFSGLNRQP